MLIPFADDKPIVQLFTEKEEKKLDLMANCDSNDLLNAINQITQKFNTVKFVDLSQCERFGLVTNVNFLTYIKLKMIGFHLNEQFLFNRFYPIQKKIYKVIQSFSVE